MAHPLPRTKLLFAVLAIIVASLNARAASDQWLDQLDNALKHYPDYLAKRTASIDSVRKAKHASPFEHEMALLQSFMSFSLDSALVHTHQAISLAATPAEETRAKMALAQLFVTSGVMYKEAAEIFNSLDRKSIEANDMLFPYYSLGIQLNRNLAAHSLDPVLKEKYLVAKVAYRDSALTLQPDNAVLLANRYIDNGDYNLAIDKLTANLTDEILTRDAAVTYNVLAQTYALQGNTEMARKYLALSATCDITNGVREYLSLQQLAMQLYEEGDYSRAHRYIHQSIDDATACNAMLRMLEMAEMLPIIDGAHEASQRKNRTVLYMLMALITLLAITLVYALYSKHRKNKSLELAYSEQHKLNESLHVSDRIKEEYITRFMNLSLEYLAQIEKYRRNLLRVAGQRDFDKLRDAIKSSKYIDKSVNDFYNHFDNAFLNLFPTFITRLHTLLEPGYTFTIKKDELLNTELRIVALMRLGISDGESICRFLRCSSSTVYNYRTRLRNAAINRDTFFDDIMLIGRNELKK